MKNTLKNLMHSLKNISQSRKEYGQMKDFQLERLEICKTCPFNSANKKEKTVKDKVNKQINKFLDFLYGIKVSDESFCTLCGCNLIHKSSQKDENCDKEKW